MGKLLDLKGYVYELKFQEATEMCLFLSQVVIILGVIRDFNAKGGL
jgi:hypothetical protein